MAATNPQKIYGKWVSGVALDFHTVSSAHIGFNEVGHDVFKTTRSELGQLLFRLKYRLDRSAAPEIIETAATFLKPHRSKVDILIPVPPSRARAVQPVITLAKGIGAAIGLPVVECVSVTRSATPLKDVTDHEKRVELLDGLHKVDVARTEGKSVLLFDDLIRSGTTLNAITDLLIQKGKAASVRVLTITRTRTNQ